MLEEFEEAVQAAEHASELRPYGYAKPHQNRAIALYRLGRFQEARNALATAMEVAQGAGAWEDVQQLKALALDFDRVHTLESLHAHLTLTLHRARHYSETEESRGGKMDSKENLETLVDGFLKRARHLVPLSTPKLVPLLAELLSYASPETCFWVNAFLARHSKELEEDFMHAALLLTGQAKGTLQQDAARLMVLFNLAVPEGDAMRWMYRLGVLEPKAAGAANFESADAALRLALRRIHPDLPTLVAVQPPVDASGIQRAKQVLLPRLNGQSSEYIPRTSVPFSSHDGQRTGVDVSILWAVFLAGLGCIGFGLLVAMLLPTMASLDAVMQSAVNGPWVIDLNAYTIEMMAVFLLLGLVLFTQGYLVALGRPDMGFPLPDAQSPGWGNITVGESAVVIQLAFSGLVLAVLVCVFIAPSIMPPNLAPRPTWVRTVIWAVAGAFSGGWTARNVIKAYRSR
jgi:tetratricopeptide (TPR) repeat protein